MGKNIHLCHSMLAVGTVLVIPACLCVCFYFLPQWPAQHGKAGKGSSDCFLQGWKTLTVRSAAKLVALRCAEEVEIQVSGSSAKEGRVYTTA